MGRKWSWVQIPPSRPSFGLATNSFLEEKMDRKLLEILACPICKGKLIYDHSQQILICKYDKIAYPIRDGIPVMIEEQAQPYTKKDN
jgi:uncharacterized protein